LLSYFLTDDKWYPFLLHQQSKRFFLRGLFNFQSGERDVKAVYSDILPFAKKIVSK